MGRTWIVVDAVIVLLFVLIGRANHHHAYSLAGTWSTTWPFATGLAIGWAIVVLQRRDGTALLSGVMVWLTTVSVGMALRVAAGQGTAFAFIVVALVFLGVLMLGSRALRSRVVRLRA